MWIFKISKIINRINKMIDNAIEENPIESEFDESKLSALETKFAKYISLMQTRYDQLKKDKEKINIMISDISHQTKTQIANIMIYSQLLEEENLSEKQREYINVLISQVDRLNLIISLLLKGSRLENGIIVISPKYQPLQPMLDYVFKQSEYRAKQKNICLYINNTKVNSYFDFKWTTEAILNIVDNAIKYTESGGKISINVIIYEFFCRIDINDTGIGISENEQTEIFKRFYRSKNVTDQEGVGIGLYIAREIISKQCGYIKVTSKVGVGSTFSVFLSI